MRLTKTNSGNWAKETTITAGGKWRKCTLHNVPKAIAEHFLSVQVGKGRKAEIREGGKVCEDGSPGFQVWAYITKRKNVMVHASDEECRNAGVLPGPENR